MLTDVKTPGRFAVPGELSIKYKDRYKPEEGSK